MSIKDQSAGGEGGKYTSQSESMSSTERLIRDVDMVKKGED